MFEDDCVALLGLDAITMLGIDLNHAAQHQRHVEIRYNDTKDLCERTKQQAIDKYPLRKQLERYIHKQTYLSERVCEAYLKKHPNDYSRVEIDENSMDIAPHVPKEYRDKLTAFLHIYHEVFASHTNTLPRKLNEKIAPPHTFKLKEGAQPTQTGRPRFGPAQTKIINDWVEWALEADLIEEAPDAAWSSRLILTPKYNHDTPKSNLPDGIRVAWAGVEVNENIEKTVPTYPDAWEQLYKVANFKYKFSADGLKQYWSIDLSPESREVTAFWTPKGLFQFKRLVMGVCWCD